MRRMASVRQAYTLAEKGHDFDDTKNDSSVRSIALFANTVELLRDHLDKQEYERCNNKLYKDSGFVIQTSTGTPVSPRNLMRNFYALIENKSDPVDGENNTSLV